MIPEATLMSLLQVHCGKTIPFLQTVCFYTLSKTGDVSYNIDILSKKKFFFPTINFIYLGN